MVGAGPRVPGSAAKGKLLDCVGLTGLTLASSGLRRCCGGSLGKSFCVSMLLMRMDPRSGDGAYPLVFLPSFSLSSPVDVLCGETSRDCVPVDAFVLSVITASIAAMPISPLLAAYIGPSLDISSVSDSQSLRLFPRCPCSQFQSRESVLLQGSYAYGSGNLLKLAIGTCSVMFDHPGLPAARWWTLPVPNLEPISWATWRGFTSKRLFNQTPFHISRFTME